MSSFLLTPEQVAFRNAALVRNLREKYKQISNYSDDALVKAYDEWFMNAELRESEDNFLEFLQGDEE